MAGCLLAAGTLMTGCGQPAAGPDLVAAASRVGRITDRIAAPPASHLATAPPVAAPDSTWSAVIEPVSGPGIVSPTGTLTATLVGDQVCFAPSGGVGRCASLAAGSTPVFAAFSPDGSRLLVVADSDNIDGAYVLDPVDASVLVLGSDGAQAYAAGSMPPRWDLSTAAWNADGSGVLLVPRTAEPTGPVLEIDLSGPVTEVLRLDASLANSSPSIWSTFTGLALVTNAGDEGNVLWWADFATHTTNRLPAEPGPSTPVVLGSADPQGRLVLVCARRPGDAAGPAALVPVPTPTGAAPTVPPALPTPANCPGSVFSPDGRYLALSTEIGGQYTLVVTDLQNGHRVLGVQLDVPAPTVPPYLTWLGDVIVARDVGGQWQPPSLVVHLDR